ncbi:MAG: ABC transporter permease [Gemmataceae bacterium]
MFDPSMALNPGSWESSIFQLSGYAIAGMAGMIFMALLIGVMTLPIFFAVIYGLAGVLWLFDSTGLLIFKIARLIVRGLLRNVLRTALTYLALFVLTFVLAFLYTVVTFLGAAMKEKEANFKVIMTEKYSIPSQMPPAYERRMTDLIMALPPDMRPVNGTDDIMTWSFVGATTDPENPRPENAIFFFCLEPKKILTMMDSLERKDLNPKELAQMEENVRKMTEDPQAIIISPTKLAKMNLRVGERIKASGIFPKDVTFEFTIVGTLPDGKFEGTSMMNKEYLLRQIDSYQRANNKPHPLAGKCLNLLWVRLPNKPAFERLAAQANDPRNFSGPEVKLETASALIGNALEGFKDIVWGMKYLLCPVMVAIMSLVMANAISIGVRERRNELAVMKVLGFRPWHVAGMVLAEALLIGLIAGFMSTALCKSLITVLNLNLGFLGMFVVPIETIPLGMGLGMAVSFIGSAGPALSAKNVKAVEVFSKVA